MGFYSLDVEDNQFWGRVVVFAEHPQPPTGNCGSSRRWCAVLHKFGPWGKHLGTEHWVAGGSDDQHAMHQASTKLDEMVAALGEVEYGDIEIELFQVEIDGNTFGLIDVSEPEAGPNFAERVAMYPGDLLFCPPWDGNYDT